MSMKKKAEWLKRQMYKDLYKDHREVNKKKHLTSQSKNMAANMTSPEKKFEKMMKNIGLDYVPQKIVDDAIYDFYIPSQNLLVEIDGDYYHGNPKIYSESQLNHMQKKNKKNDIYKDNLAIGLGYKLERIWEKDINENYRAIFNKFKKYKTTD